MSAGAAAGDGTQPTAGPAEALTVKQALAQALVAGLERLDGHLLLAHALGLPGERSRAWLMAHPEALLSAAQASQFAALCQQRADGVPAAYLLGEQEFHGLRLQVNRAVLVPRPDTETLVDWALALLPGWPGRPRVLDLGTGSGAIALALAHRCATATVSATDLSPEALAVASTNAQNLGLSVAWHVGHWWQALPPEAQFELVLSNPPYIAGDDHHLPSLRHEPRLALTPGGDGLGALRAIVAGAPAHLTPGGWLLLEHGWDQAAAVAALLAAQGFTEVQHRRDLAGHLRCTGGRLQARQEPAIPNAPR